MDILAPIKAHPVLAGGAALAAVLAFVILRSAGGGSAPDGGGYVAGGSSVGDAGQLQLQQAALASHSADVGASLQASLAQDATNRELGKLAIAYKGNEAELAANIAAQQINAGLQLGMQQSALEARVAEANISAGVSKAALDAATTQSMYGALIKQSELSAQNTNALINAQVEASKPHGLFSFIFG